MPIVVVGPRCWGAGKTLQAALAKARQNYPTYGGSNPMPYNAYEASEDFEVDGMGTISARELKRIREVRFEGGEKIVRTGAAIRND